MKNPPLAAITALHSWHPDSSLPQYFAMLLVKLAKASWIFLFDLATQFIPEQFNRI